MPTDLLRFIMPVELQAAADGAKKLPTFNGTAYTGGQMTLGGWHQPVVVDLRGMQIPEKFPVVVDHDSSAQGIIGHGSAVVQNNQLLLSGVVSASTPVATQFVAAALAGFPWQLSIGAMPIERQAFNAGDTVHANGQTFKAGPAGLTLVTKSSLKEITATALAADDRTSVSVAASLKGTKTMPTNTPTAPAFEDHIHAAWDQPGLTDGQRVQTRYVAAKLADPNLAAEAQTLFLQAGSGAMQFSAFDAALLRVELRDAQLRAIRAERPQAPAMHGSTLDGKTTQGMVLEAAFFGHLGREGMGEKVLGAEPMQRARDLRINSTIDWCKAALQMSGQELPLGRDQIIKASFSSTYSLPGILSNVANKMLLDAYQAYPSVARVIAKKLSAKDFKSHCGYRLTGDVALKELPPDGTIKHGTLGESAYPFLVKTYARMLGLPRTDIVNDDLSAFDSFPAMFGRAAANNVESLFWTLVLANTGSFFGAGNKNYLSGATSALSLEGLGKAVSTFLKIVDSNGDPIGVTPKFLVCPPELKATADSLYRSTAVVQSGGSDATQAPAASPFFGLYQPLASPHLSNANYAGYSADAWYLFGNPADVASHGIAYLDGKEAPTVETESADFDKLGVQFRAYTDVGVCQVDSHGGVMAAGK